MRKYAAILAVIALMAAAFFLPEYLSALHDRRLLNNPSIQVQSEDQEGFAESLQLTVAEKLALLRGGTLTSMELRQEIDEWQYDAAGDGGSITAYLDGEAKDVPVDLQAAAEEDLLAYNEAMSQRWEPRKTAVRQEVRNLQALGGLPMLWSDGETPEFTNYGELLYMDQDTRVNFQAYYVTLLREPYELELLVDVQSGRILSFKLQWEREGAPSWGLRGAAGFGGVWRNYWGLDSVGSGWYTEAIRNMLERPEELSRSNGDAAALEQVTFTYDYQSMSVPLFCRSMAGRIYSITWNR